MSDCVAQREGLTGEFSPSGLKNGGLLTFVTLSSTSWTALPPTPLSGRNAISIQNQSGTEIKLDYKTTEATYKGVVVGSGNERFYNISDTIQIYAKAAVGSPTILIEEIS